MWQSWCVCKGWMWMDGECLDERLGGAVQWFTVQWEAVLHIRQPSFQHEHVIEGPGPDMWSCKLKSTDMLKKTIKKNSSFHNFSKHIIHKSVTHRTNHNPGPHDGPAQRLEVLFHSHWQGWLFYYLVWSQMDLNSRVNELSHTVRKMFNIVAAMQRYSCNLDHSRYESWSKSIPYQKFCIDTNFFLVLFFFKAEWTAYITSEDNNTLSSRYRRLFQ